MRIGIGYDFHRLVDERKLILGGVEIPAIKGLEGHSDADVVLHAVCDALLGAAGKGDIGQHFPNHDNRYKDISSKELLKAVCSILSKEEWRINNVDVIVILEEPKIEPFKNKMRSSIAEVLKIEDDKVNIKATTTEGIGSLGRGEAVAAQAVA
ncbi:MAG: 2-C-methyl-D-erythritol 2,4-cyclodiphosphate synthase, partial [Candidatus Omnitrophota bacterium]|nr:2-C-methyl-D-erythritol 2,4-cyclodiphosphate synthase [Candidatus Omnitrophota bacterium]